MTALYRTFLIVLSMGGAGWSSQSDSDDDDRVKEVSQLPPGIIMATCTEPESPSH